MKPGPKPLLGRPLTPKERQARRRAKLAEGAPKAPAPRKAADRRSRPQRWRDAVAELIALQSEYQAWLGSTPYQKASPKAPPPRPSTRSASCSSRISKASPRPAGSDAISARTRAKLRNQDPQPEM